jgi:hypothetical protein
MAAIKVSESVAHIQIQEDTKRFKTSNSYPNFISNSPRTSTGNMAMSKSLGKFPKDTGPLLVRV